MPKPPVLDQIIDIEMFTTFSNELGEAGAGTWSVLYSRIFANVAALRGREVIAAEQAQALADMRFIVNSRPGIAADQRIRWRDGIYVIVSPPLPFGGGNRYLELRALTSKDTGSYSNPAAFALPGYFAEDYAEST
jgi:SPP1 family predicted phage head-tail adaptor